MSRPQRAKLIERLEALRGSKVLAYVTGDRTPVTAQIGDDAVRPMLDHLRVLKHVPKLDLFIYSRGGAMDVPWRIVTALRQTADEWGLLVPFRANSAATLIALGADHIILGRQGELGAIDPQLGFQRFVPQPGGGQAVVQDQVSLEDIMAYTKFVQERAGLSDQDALSSSLSKLTERLNAVVLGNAYRTHLHIRDVARKMILSRKEPVPDQAMKVIIETLAEKVYAHGHAIGLKEAKEIGLPVTSAEDALDDAMWHLLNEYEDHLKLLAPLDVFKAVATTDLYTEDACICLIESSWGTHEFLGQIEARARRQMPPNLNISLNLNLQLPQGFDAVRVGPELQMMLQEMLQRGQAALLGQAQQALQQALQQQAPLQGVDAAFRGGVWEKTA